MMALSRVLVAILLYCSVKGAPIDPQIDDGLSLRILHTNDMHSRFEETSSYSPECSKKDAEQKKCYGGFARLATLVREARNLSDRTLFLNAGDTYLGSEYYTVHKLMENCLQIHEYSRTGCNRNHEFDDGVEGLVPFLKASTFPVVAANLNLDLEPSLKLPKLMNSTIIEINGTKIGVIGYLTPETQSISNPGKVVFLDEITAIREEVAKLKTQDVKIFIALGHSGIDMDKKIAREVEDIDLVIGGHSHTFLYSGEQPDSDVPQGLYPTEITQKNAGKSDRKVYIVQAYAYTKYLGDLRVKFDEDGEITSIEGTPILVDSNVTQAPDILKELEVWRKDVDKEIPYPIGSTKVFLDGEEKSCRLRECNLGNLITDAMINYNVKNSEHEALNNSWTHAAIAFYNSGDIRASIPNNYTNQICMKNIKSVLPFESFVYSTKLTGETILNMLEHSVESLKTNSSSDLKGTFLQVSGLRVTYDLSKPALTRVVSALALCSSCAIPKYSAIQKNLTYGVLINDFLYNGGDGYKMIKKSGSTHYSLEISVANALFNYVNQTSPVYPAAEGRIRFEHEKLEGTQEYTGIHLEDETERRKIEAKTNKTAS